MRLQLVMVLLHLLLTMGMLLPHCNQLCRRHQRQSMYKNQLFKFKKRSRFPIARHAWDAWSCILAESGHCQLIMTKLFARNASVGRRRKKSASESRRRNADWRTHDDARPESRRCEKLKSASEFRRRTNASRRNAVVDWIWHRTRPRQIMLMIAIGKCRIRTTADTNKRRTGKVIHQVTPRRPIIRTWPRLRCNRRHSSNARCTMIRTMQSTMTDSRFTFHRNGDRTCKCLLPRPSCSIFLRHRQQRQPRRHLKGLKIDRTRCWSIASIPRLPTLKHRRRHLRRLTRRVMTRRLHRGQRHRLRGLRTKRLRSMLGLLRPRRRMAARHRSNNRKQRASSTGPHRSACCLLLKVWLHLPVWQGNQGALILIALLLLIIRQHPLRRHSRVAYQVTSPFDPSNSRDQHHK
mmetsp:Transcript_17416/g.49174  ORF Transcript_17416/g.49174 Transcript_17416/m.49174 type:complete len:406 (-) Transcript_17416:154-1371(-)